MKIKGILVIPFRKVLGGRDGEGWGGEERERGGK